MRRNAVVEETGRRREILRAKKLGIREGAYTHADAREFSLRKCRLPFLPLVASMLSELAVMSTRMKLNAVASLTIQASMHPLQKGLGLF